MIITASHSDEVLGLISPNPIVVIEIKLQT